jgi:hypothetical protein
MSSWQDVGGDDGTAPSGSAAASSSAAPVAAAGAAGAVVAFEVDQPRVPRPRFSNGSWTVPGGWIVFDAEQKSLDAHCEFAIHHMKGNACRCNRKATAYEKAKQPETLAQGRPLGYLLLWLSLGCRCERNCVDHRQMSSRRERTAAHKKLLSWEARNAKRQWAKGRPELAGLFLKERKLRPLEREEPDACL